MGDSNSSIIQVENLVHRYDERTALKEIGFKVSEGESFGLLGPNGGGKTTLFRILATLLIPSAGTVRLFGMDVIREASAVRRRFGVVFQTSSLDKKLTISENLKHQGHLYGLKGADLHARIDELLNQFGLSDRRKDLVEKLSGGLRRRVELAKCLLHSPDLLLMDEPTTGLDPTARLDFWNYLEEIKSKQGMTIFLTTHFMEEADRCDRLGILDEGNLVALGEPNILKDQVSGDVITIGTKDPVAVREKIQKTFEVEATLVENSIRIERHNGHEFIPSLIEAFPGQIETVTFGKPTLEDVFIHLTGRRLQKDAD